MALKMPTWKEWLLIGIAAVCLCLQWWSMVHTPSKGRPGAAAKP